MKTILKSSLYFYLAFLLGLLPFFGCGGDDDVTPSEGFKPHRIRKDSEPHRKDSNFQSGPLWKLSDAYIAELLKLDIPSNWAWMDIDKETYGTIMRNSSNSLAIPEVRYLLHPLIQGI